MGFTGYQRDVQDFFAGLKANNTKEWFEANRKRYDEGVLAPSVELVKALEAPLMDLSPPLKAEAKVNGSIRRIFRDTRFSADKTPYHTYLHLIFWTGGHPNRSPGAHIILGADGFGYGAGQWAFEGEALERFRAAIVADGGAEMDGVAAALKKAGLVLDPPGLKNVPRGFDADAAGAHWLQYKGLVAKAEQKPYPDAMFGPEGVDYVVALCKAMAPLNGFLSEKVF